MTRHLLTREDVEGGFLDLAREAVAAGKVIDLAVFGGVAMMLTLPARPATRDVDAIALNDPAFVREAAKRVASERGWPEDWLNDAVKGFLSERQTDRSTMSLFRTYPSEREAGLRVYVARPEYLLAMKCIAMRLDSPDGSRDVEDIKALISMLQLTQVGEVLNIVAHYYPDKRIPPKTQFGVEELMQQATNDAKNGRKT